LAVLGDGAVGHTWPRDVGVKRFDCLPKW
jgi:hypothetical protein